MATDSAFDIKKLYSRCKNKNIALVASPNQRRKNGFTNSMFPIDGFWNNHSEYYYGFVESKFAGQKQKKQA